MFAASMPIFIIRLLVFATLMCMAHENLINSQCHRLLFIFHNQLISNGKLCLFQASHGYEDGEQQRDFVYVEDCVKVNLWFLDHPNKSGIFNVGTGHATAFNKIASSVLKWNQNHGRDGEIVYIPFPEHLKGAYQSFTQADISALRAAGY